MLPPGRTSSTQREIAVGRSFLTPSLRYGHSVSSVDNHHIFWCGDVVHRNGQTVSHMLYRCLVSCSHLPQQVLSKLSHGSHSTHDRSEATYAIDNGVEGVPREQIRRHKFGNGERVAEQTVPHSYPASVV